MPHSIASISEKSLISPVKKRTLAVARPAEEEWCGPTDQSRGMFLGFGAQSPDL